MLRKLYMAQVYANYWVTAREQIYGFLEYDRNLCRYICAHVPAGGRILEVAIGTGYPFAQYLAQAGYLVHGIDISPQLVEKCRQTYPNIHCRVGDAENIDYQDGFFDMTYCFHSTWYFPNLNRAIDEMLRVTRPAGLVLFDIQNRNNKSIRDAYEKRIAEVRTVGGIKRLVANTAKMFLHVGRPGYNFLIHEVPTYPETIYQHLERRPISGYHIMVRREDDSLELKEGRSSFEEFARLVFVVTR